MPGVLTQRRGDRPGYSETFPFHLEMTPGERRGGTGVEHHRTTGLVPEHLIE